MSRTISGMARHVWARQSWLALPLLLAALPLQAREDLIGATGSAPGLLNGYVLEPELGGVHFLSRPMVSATGQVAFNAYGSRVEPSSPSGATFAMALFFADPLSGTAPVELFRSGEDAAVDGYVGFQYVFPQVLRWTESPFDLGGTMLVGLTLGSQDIYGNIASLDRSVILNVMPTAPETFRYEYLSGGTVLSDGSELPQLLWGPNIYPTGATPFAISGEERVWTSSATAFGTQEPVSVLATGGFSPPPLISAPNVGEPSGNLSPWYGLASVSSAVSNASGDIAFVGTLAETAFPLFDVQDTASALYYRIPGDGDSGGFDSEPESYVVVAHNVLELGGKDFVFRGLMNDDRELVYRTCDGACGNYTGEVRRFDILGGSTVIAETGFAYRKLNPTGLSANGEVVMLAVLNGATPQDDLAVIRADGTGDDILFRENQFISLQDSFGGFADEFRITNLDAPIMSSEGLVLTRASTTNGIRYLMTDGEDIVRVGNGIAQDDEWGFSYSTSETSMYLSDAFGEHMLDAVSATINAHGQVAFSATGFAFNTQDPGVFEDSSVGVVLFTPDLFWRRGSGDFSDSDNWTLGLRPSTMHDVYVATASDTTVTLDAPQATFLHSLTVGGGDGVATFIADSALHTDALTVRANGEFVMRDVLTSGGGQVAIDASAAVADWAPNFVNNEGTITVESGFFQIWPTILYDSVTNEPTLVPGSGELRNFGTVRQSGGFIDIERYRGTGTLETTGGELFIADYEGMIGGKFGGIATIGRADGLAGGLELTGSLTLLSLTDDLVNAGRLRLRGGSLIAELADPFGSLEERISLTNQGGAIIDGGGRVDANVINDGVIDLKGNLVIDGNLDSRGRVTAILGELLTVTGDFTNDGTTDLIEAGLTVGGTLRNRTQGRISGTGTVTGAVINDGGIIHAMRPIAIVVDDETSEGGGVEITIGSPSPLTITDLTGGNVNGGELRVDNGATLAVQSAFSSTGSIHLRGIDATMTGGTITNTGSIFGIGRVANQVANAGGAIRAEGGQLTLAASGSTNTGFAGGVDTAGRIEAVGVDSIVMFTEGLAVNAGIIELRDGATFDNNRNPITNTGLMLISGTLRHGGLINNGTFVPGQSPGTATSFADYVQGENGSLSIELAGLTRGVADGYDWLNVQNGRAVIAGTLQVDLLDGFDPQAGDVFEFLTASEGVFGQFEQLLAPNLSGRRWQLIYLPNAVQLGVSEVPLPPSAGLFGTAALALFAARKRARRFAACRAVPPSSKASVH